MTAEKYNAPHELHRFFVKLLAFKDRLHKKALDEGDVFLNEIYRELDEIIKNKDLEET